MTTKQISASSKLGQYYLQRYNDSEYLTIYDYYEKPSGAKIEIYEHLKIYCSSMGGRDFKILGGNSYHFTAGWLKGDKLIIETPYNRYCIDLTL